MENSISESKNVVNAVKGIYLYIVYCFINFDNNRSVKIGSFEILKQRTDFTEINLYKVIYYIKKILNLNCKFQNAS